MQYLNNLSVNENAAVQIFVDRLRADFEPQVADVRLFGSKARGQATPESDIDVLVLVNTTDYTTVKHAILWLAAEVSLQYDVLLSPRVISVPVWQTMSKGHTLFYFTVCHDSIALLPEKTSSCL